jgi:hypothetical protein
MLCWDGLCCVGSGSVMLCGVGLGCVGLGSVMLCGVRLGCVIAMLGIAFQLLSSVAAELKKPRSPRLEPEADIDRQTRWHMLLRGQFTVRSFCNLFIDELDFVTCNPVCAYVIEIGTAERFGVVFRVLLVNIF